MQKIGLTGATGFVGRHVVDRLAGDGRQLVCLARPNADRTLEDAPGLGWLAGRLGDAGARGDLVRGADTIIHIAGLTKALGPDGFHRTNVAATASLVSDARKAGVRHFILISSLAASRPDVSPYAASKALAEQAALSLAGDMAVTIIRPPAVLGPGDGATRDVMGLLARGWMVFPSRGKPQSRFSWIDVDDLARFIRLKAGEKPARRGETLSPSSGLSVSWDDIADAAETVLSRKVRRIGLAAPLVKGTGIAADIAALLTRRAFILSSGKANELLQRDWQSDFEIDAATPLHQTLARCFLGRVGFER